MGITVKTKFGEADSDVEFEENGKFGCLALLQPERSLIFFERVQM